MFSFDDVKNFDPEVAQAMEQELERQRTHIELIASENLVSKAVMAAMGSHLTNKYAEGYPGKRYYGGCEYVDIVEDLARERAADILHMEVRLMYLVNISTLFLMEQMMKVSLIMMMC